MNVLQTGPAQAYSNKDKDKQLWDVLIDELTQHQFWQNPTAERQCFHIFEDDICI